MAKKSKPIRRKFVLMNKNTPFQYQEAYKSLRTNLNFMAMGKACKKLRYAYQCKERSFFRSTAAHNTVMVEGVEQ